MSIGEPKSGDLIFYRARTDFGVARIDLVRDGHFTCFPWNPLHQRWDKGRRRIKQSAVLSRLSPDAVPAEITERLNVLRNGRDGKRAAANRWFSEQVAKLTEELA